MEDLLFSILYILLCFPSQPSWVAEDVEKPEGTCIAGEWNGAKAYGEGRGDEGKDSRAAGEGGLPGAAPLFLRPKSLLD